MYLVFCAFLAIVTVGNCAQKRTTREDNLLDVLDISQCEYQIETIACFDDKLADRVLPDQILNSRSRTSAVYEGPGIQWGNYNHWLANFICKCATKMMKMKDVESDFIGIQYYGECWVSLQEHITKKSVQQKATRGDCVDGDYNRYSADHMKCQVYTGTRLSNFFYKVSKIKNEKESDCPFFTKMGCFKDTVPRGQPEHKPLPLYVMNERDPTLPNWNNFLIDWKNWGNGYLSEMICRCAKKAKEMNKRFFGIQFYAECWVGDDEDKIDEYGITDTCIDGKFLPTCSKISKNVCQATPCAGQALTNMIYQIHQGPLGCLGNPCAAGETCFPNGVNNHDCVKN